MLRASGAGFTGNGCVGHVASPGTVLCGTGRSSIAEDRLAGDAIEDEHQRHLRHHRDRGNGAAVALDVDQRRRRRHVVVPEVVMNELPVPLQLPGRRVERDDGVAVEVRALAIPAVIVGRRRRRSARTRGLARYRW